MVRTRADPDMERIRHYGFAFEGKRVLIGSDDIPLL